MKSSPINETQLELQLIVKSIASQHLQFNFSQNFGWEQFCLTAPYRPNPQIERPPKAKRTLDTNAGCRLAPSNLEKRKWCVRFYYLVMQFIKLLLFLDWALALVVRPVSSPKRISCGSHVRDCQGQSYTLHKRLFLFGQSGEEREWFSFIFRALQARKIIQKTGLRCWTTFENCTSPRENRFPTATDRPTGSRL